MKNMCFLKHMKNNVWANMWKHVFHVKNRHAGIFEHMKITHVFYVFFMCSTIASVSVKKCVCMCGRLDAQQSKCYGGKPQMWSHMCVGRVW